ncbi:MAG: hypothetical protein HYR60_24470 [Acidobacteria bacterium]|nr:hypothetical protein [Acidobacteriota bacterium]
MDGTARVSRIREYLKLAGKGDRKVIAVFAVSPAAADRVARHVRAPGIPLWFFTCRQPDDKTAALYDRVVVG